MSQPARPLHRNSHRPNWRAALLWLMLALPWAQAWLICHEFSHSTKGLVATELDASRFVSAGVPGGDEPTPPDAHGTCVLCLSASALAHAVAPAADLAWALPSTYTHTRPVVGPEAWRPATPRYYASRAPPLKA